MLCFSVDSRDSLENARSRWVTEIVDHCEGVKLVLVALKCDLRNVDDQPEGGNEGSSATAGGEGNNGSGAESGNRKSLITYEEGLEVARAIGALRYLECSARRNRGVNEAFTEAARCALSAKPRGNNNEEEKSKGCIIS
jgi:Rho family protein